MRFRNDLVDPWQLPLLARETQADFLVRRVECERLQLGGHARDRYSRVGRLLSQLS